MKEQLDNQTNINERRFTLATETSARTRLDDFRDGVKDFQKQKPEVLGATVYGSMIKGDQAKETSDIDAFLYIDGEKIPEDIKAKNLRNTEIEENIYRESFLEELNVTQDTYEYYKDMKVKLLSDEILDNEINKRIKYEENLNNYKEMLTKNYTNETTEDDKKKLLNEEPNIVKISPSVSGMFHARVGTGIEKYRCLFLDKINALPNKEMAEKIWGDVYFDLKTYEQRSDPRKKIKIPATLNEALRVYHPDLYKNIKNKENENKIIELKSQINSVLL